MSAVGKASPELSVLALVGQFVTDLGTFVHEKFPKVEPALSGVLEPFGEYLARKYG